MFLRYMNQKKAVNLDNFDYITVIRETSEWQIRACRKEDRISTSCYSGGSDTHSNGISYIIIKSFDNGQDANAWYDKLQYAWINGHVKIFEVD